MTKKEQPISTEDLREIASLVMLDIQQFDDNVWSRWFLAKKAYVYAPDKVVEFNRIQGEYMESVPSDLSIDKIVPDGYYDRMIPIWAAYSNLLTNISTEIQELCTQQ